VRLRRTAPPTLSAFPGTSPQPRPQHVETRAGICVCCPDQASQGPTSHVRSPDSHSRRTEPSPTSPSVATHTTSLSSLPSSHHRACCARAAVAHRDVADATAIATVAVHHLRGTDGRPLSPTRSKTADGRPPPPAHRLPPQRHERATRAGKGDAHRVVAVRRMALHPLRHSSGARVMNEPVSHDCGCGGRVEA